jgi:hypothetical protein
MGKSTPPSTQVVFDSVDEAEPLYDALPPADKRRLDFLFKRMTKYKDILTVVRPLRPIILLCIFMILEVYKMNNELHHAQYEEIKRQRKAIEAAGIAIEEETPSTKEEFTLIASLSRPNADKVVVVDEDVLQIPQ